MMMNRGVLYCIGLSLVIAVLFASNLLLGSVSIPAENIVRILLGDTSEKASWRYIILESRLPQGGGLSVGSLQFSGFAAVLIAAFIGAMAVMAVIFFFSTLVRSHVMLLIIGIMIGYISNSAISLLNFFATDEGVKSYMVWGLGSFGGVSMANMPVFVGVSLFGLFGALLLIKPLNALLLGDRYAENLGVNIIAVRNWLLVVTGLLTAVTTAFCGPVAFIGLAVPHMARLLLTTDNHRQLLPATMLCGAVVALVCNLLCFLPGEGGVIPLNAVTPLIGAPVIIYVILINHESI